MKLWRISDFADLNGEGGRLFEGRWNRGGRAMVYTAESSALAMLEQLAYLARRALPPPYQLLQLDAPDGCAVTLFAGKMVRWEVEATRSWGEAWLEGATTPLARVPSALAPEAYNLLINPAHPDAARIRIASAARHHWDDRLFTSNRN